MSKIKGFTVAFDEDVDAETFREYYEKALFVMKYVVAVTPVESDVDDWIIRQRVQMEIEKRIYDALRESR